MKTELIKGENMNQFTRHHLFWTLWMCTLLLLLVTGCGLGFRIDPDGMTFQWDWPDNVSAVLPQKNSEPSPSPLTRSPPPG